MKRKMLISIALITIMLLNCILPLFVVNAAEGEEIQLNSKLYTAIVKSLETQGIAYNGSDVTHTLFMSEAELSKVTKLNLNEGAISDLTGLEAFSGLTHLELSGNNLSKESNLGVLNTLSNLTYLDLSTNNLDDVSEIFSLISRLKENGTIILSGQNVNLVETAVVDIEEESNNEETASYKLPSILELAGYIKASWKTESSVAQNWGGIAPSVKSMPMYVSEVDPNIQIRIASETGAAYRGLVRLSIYIYDDPTEAAQANNPNKASENILNGSRFNLYYVVHSSNESAITTMDTNLYNAIKEQLTAGQKVNPELASYPYAVDTDGNTIYETYTYVTKSIGGKTYHVLTNTATKAVEYAYNPDTNTLYESNGSTIGARVDTAVEETVITTVADNGDMTSKAGYKIAYTSEETGVTLYEAAYDAPKTFVIDNTVLMNKIKSLILNNKQIRDLSGIEKFVGLTSYLNVSHNYLSSIEPLYLLEANKGIMEGKLQETYNYWLNTRQYGNLSKASTQTKEDKKAIEENIKSVETAVSQIINLLKSAATLDKTAENYANEIKSKSDSILNIIKEIEGYVDEEGNEVKGHLDLLAESMSEMNSDIASMYSYLDKLYEIYNNEYRLTTLLSDNVNYQTYEEYKAYYDATHTTTEAAKSLLTEEISYLTALESKEGLSELDKKLFASAFGIDFENKDTETPLVDYFKKFLDETALNRVQIINVLDKIREIGVYSEMANYCLIKRMNEDTATGYCYEKDYLENRIKEFGYDEIPSDFENTLLEKMKNNDVATDLYKVYKDYETKTLTYRSADSKEIRINAGIGEYKKVSELSKKSTIYGTAELISLATADVEGADEDNVTAVLSKIGTAASANIIKSISIYEDVNEKGVTYVSPTTNLFIYNQMMSLANKLLNGNVERYVTLPRLKKLDISYNAELEDLDGITSLTQISEIYADYDYIADVTNVNWAALKNLKKLSLSYNYISDISVLAELTNLNYLNVSNNLIAGELKISEEQYAKLFKNLKEFDLSGNQITDVTSLLIYLDYLTNGNYANYLAREDTMNINLKNQNINIDIEEPIILSDHPTTVDVELPKIFTQLLAIDTERTAFGETSQNGRVESEGTYVTLNTRTPGEKEAKVVVKAMSGNGTTVDTCIGEGTKATIKYVVGSKQVSKVTINPSEDLSAKPGENKVFTAKVEGEDLTDTKVRWSVQGNKSTNTVINSEGRLTIGADERADYITVIAASNANPTVNDSVRVKIVRENANLSLTINPSEGVSVKAGETRNFTATLEGTNITNRTINWTVTGNTSINTSISGNGVLTVAEDEKSDALTVTAVSAANETVSATVSVKVIKENKPVNPTNITITINPSENVEVKVGENKEFTARVEGTNLEDKTVTWSVNGNKSANTTISQEGVLAVAADETATAITVVATSNADKTIVKTVSVRINKAQDVNNIVLGYEVKDEMVTGVKTKTPVADFKSNLLNEDNYVAVVTKNGEEVKTGYIGTGMFVEIRDLNGKIATNENGEPLVYSVSVKGDVDGNGIANAVDSLLIKAYRAEVQGSQLGIEAFESADINNDTKVNAADARLLLYHRAEVKGYNLDYQK